MKPPKRLIAFDMDSTLIEQEVIDELARQKGVYDEVARITAEAMGGKLSFDESLQRRAAMLAGLRVSEFDAVFARVRLTAGAEELIKILKKNGFKIALLSGGFTFVADRLKAKLQLDHTYSNRLEISGSQLTGKVIPPIVNAERKAELLAQIAAHEGVALDQVVAVGDGANDLLMLERAGIGIAFCAKPVVSERAKHSIHERDLRLILPIIGISATA